MGVALYVRRCTVHAMSDFGTSEDFEAVRDGLEKNRSASATDEALAALDRIQARLRKAQESREWFLSENAKLINERNRGWHNHEVPEGLTSHSHTQGPYAHLREAEAEAERQERYIEALEAERDDLAGEQGRYLQEWQQMKAERDRLQGMLEQAEEDLNVYVQQTIDVNAENARLRDAEAERDRLRDALERAIARQAPDGTGDA